MKEDLFFNSRISIDYLICLYHSLKFEHDYRNIRLVKIYHEPTFYVDLNRYEYVIQYNKNSIILDNPNDWIIEFFDNTINYRNFQIDKVVL